MKLEMELHDLTTIGPNIWVFGITGGPCGAKDNGIAYLVEKLTGRDYKVLVKPEEATKLILNGVRPWDKELDPVGFQQGVLIDTLCQEQCFLSAAVAYRNAGRKVIVLCNRGTMDGAAYLGRNQFSAMLELNKLTPAELCEQRYHAVIHLRTAALGAEQYYQLGNNKARTESLEEARVLDEKTLAAWQRHPHLRIIDNSTGIDGKLHRLFVEICSVIGDPIPLEKERKFLIKRPDLSLITERYYGSDIVQTYLHCPIDGEERRVRARGEGRSWTYFHTIKTEVSVGVRAEPEKIIGFDSYQALLTQRDPKMETIEKRRINFFWQEQCFEVDLFQKPRNDLFLMEAEVTDISGPLPLPPFIEVIKEVTGDKAYSNKAIASGSDVHS